MIIIGDVMTPPPRFQAPSQGATRALPLRGKSAKGGRRAPRAEQVLAFCWHRTQVDRRRPWCAGGKRGPTAVRKYYFSSVVFFLAAT